MPTSSPLYMGLERVCNEIEISSGGRLSIEPFAGGGIWPAFEEIDGIDAGAIDMACAPFTNLVHHFPTGALFCTMVNGMKPVEFYGWLTEGGGHELEVEMLGDWNVVILKGSGWLEGPEVFAHAKAPIDTLEDVKGLKFRTGGEGGAVLDKMGMASVQLTGGEIYDAMKRGVIDACECAGPTTNWRLAFQEIAPYMYISSVRAPSLYGNFIYNKAAWDDLPDDLKHVIESVTRVESVRYYTESVKADAEDLQKFKDYGTNVLKVSKEIEDELKKQAEIFYDDKAANDPFAAEVLKSQREFRAIWEGYVDLW